MTRKKKQWSNKERFKIALEASRNEQTMPEICEKYKVSASQVYSWKKELMEKGEEIFDKRHSKSKAKEEEARAKEMERLYAKIGQLTIEKDFLTRALGKWKAQNESSG